MTSRRKDGHHALVGMPVTTISDALDRLGIAGQVLGIKPVDHSMRMCGPAFTVRMGAAGRPPGTVGDFLDDVAAGGVVVIDNGGRDDVTVWGDLMTLAALQRGIAGAVIDGACRDTASIRTAAFPVFARAIHMRTGKDRVEARSIGGAATLGSISVLPGDVVVGDADGVVVVPADALTAVVQTARAIEQAESDIRVAIASGVSLWEARARYGYHSLQRPTAGRVPGR